MAYLHNDKELFQDAIALAYEKNGIMAQAIANDRFFSKRTWNEY